MTTQAITRDYIAQKQAERAALEEQALADSQLWTVQIAYYKDRAFVVIHHGRIGEAEHEAFVSQHREAGMFMDPQVVLGDKLHVRQQVCKMANMDEITIRVIGAPKRQPVTPGIYQL